MMRPVVLQLCVTVSVAGAFAPCSFVHPAALGRRELPLHGRACPLLGLRAEAHETETVLNPPDPPDVSKSSRINSVFHERTDGTTWSGRPVPHERGARNQWGEEQERGGVPLPMDPLTKQLSGALVWFLKGECVCVYQAAFVPQKQIRIFMYVCM